MDRHTINLIIGRNLVNRRVELGLTAHAVATLAGVPLTHLQEQESGMEPLDCDELCRIAAAIHSTVDDLAGVIFSHQK